MQNSITGDSFTQQHTGDTRGFSHKHSSIRESTILARGWGRVVNNHKQGYWSSYLLKILNSNKSRIVPTGLRSPSRIARIYSLLPKRNTVHHNILVKYYHENGPVGGPSRSHLEAVWTDNRTSKKQAEKPY